MLITAYVPLVKCRNEIINRHFRIWYLHHCFWTVYNFGTLAALFLSEPWRLMAYQVIVIRQTILQLKTPDNTCVVV
jgi:hypothetical protein